MAEIFYFLGMEQFQPEIIFEHARLAEAAGFDGVLVSEHFNPWVADESAAGFTFSTLGAIAISTKHIKIMTGVVCPLFRYHPAVIAQAAATLDRLSNGRFILGLGLGEAINESPLGFHFPPYNELYWRMQEAITIINRLLAGDTLTFKGEYYKTQSAHLYSPPISHVPVYLAAGGTRSATLAGHEADGVITSVKNVEDTENRVVSPAKSHAKDRHKQNFKIVSSRWTVFAQNNEEAWEALKPWRGLRAPNRDKAIDPQELQSEADRLSKSDVLSKYKIITNSKEYIETYSPLIRTLNSDVIVIQTTSINQLELIKMLGKEVVPELKIVK
jgi:coenzyme F420-dependent glucose-6-phosphate dehydrogenase